jgi:hypothetical protein
MRAFIKQDMKLALTDILRGIPKAIPARSISSSLALFCTRQANAHNENMGDKTKVSANI